MKVILVFSFLIFGISCVSVLENPELQAEVSPRIIRDPALEVQQFEYTLTEDFVYQSLGTADDQTLARLLALYRFFPAKIQKIEPLKDDWSIQIKNETFRWAGGRMIHTEIHNTTGELEKYLPIWDTSGLGLPIWERMITPELEQELQFLNSTYGFDPRIRNQHFLDILYGVPDEESAERVMENIQFLGKPLEIHPLLVEPLERVEQGILESMNEIPEVEDFVRDLDQVWGFFWRSIAGTTRRSLHSYGLAIDLLPQYYGRRFPYWRWALEGGYPNWWRLSPRDYWYPPREVVRAFEVEGFVWGGRWIAFDTIHFEYRPEIMAFETLLPISPE